MTVPGSEAFDEVATPTWTPMHHADALSSEAHLESSRPRLLYQTILSAPGSEGGHADGTVIENL